jgi:hypothetical protein
MKRIASCALIVTAFFAPLCFGQEGETRYKPGTSVASGW